MSIYMCQQEIYQQVLAKDAFLKNEIDDFHVVFAVHSK